MIMAGLVGALLAAIITVIALNFVAGEKQIQRKLEHRYTIDDPQFRRELGILLGPADHRRQPGHQPGERRRDLPRDARRR